MVKKVLNNDKNAGPDLLINEFNINAREELIDKLTLLCNIVLSQDLIDNYRGVTLLSTLGKLFTRLLNNGLLFSADTYGILIEVRLQKRSFNCGQHICFQ